MSFPCTISRTQAAYHCNVSRLSILIGNCYNFYLTLLNQYVCTELAQNMCTDVIDAREHDADQISRKYSFVRYTTRHASKVPKTRVTRLECFRIERLTPIQMNQIIPNQQEDELDAKSCPWFVFQPSPEHHIEANYSSADGISRWNKQARWTSRLRGGIIQLPTRKESNANWLIINMLNVTVMIHMCEIYLKRLVAEVAFTHTGLLSIWMIKLALRVDIELIWAWNWRRYVDLLNAHHADWGYDRQSAMLSFEVTRDDNCTKSACRRVLGYYVRTFGWLGLSEISRFVRGICRGTCCNMKAMVAWTIPVVLTQINDTILLQDDPLCKRSLKQVFNQHLIPWY